MARKFAGRYQVFNLEEEDLDAIKVFLVYILMKNTELGAEDIYDYIFGEGKKILWN